MCCDCWIWVIDERVTYCFLLNKTQKEKEVLHRFVTFDSYIEALHFIEIHEELKTTPESVFLYLNNDVTGDELSETFHFLKEHIIA